MASQIKPHAFLFKGQALQFRPLVHLRRFHFCCFRLLHGGRPQGKEAHLAAETIAQKCLGPFHAQIQHGHQLCPMGIKRIKGTDLDQTFNDFTIYFGSINPGAEISQRMIIAICLTLLNNGVQSGPAHVLDGSKAKTDVVAAYSEIAVGSVDVRGQYFNVHLAAFLDVFHHFIGVIHITGQKRGHKLGRIMRLKVGSLVSYQGIAGRVRLIKTVTSKFFH